jgi:Bacterial Ig-like domain (group 3)
VVESLEDRALLSAVAFNPPDLKPYIHLAYEGVNTAPATINTMTKSLETQLTSGPLADLQAGTVDSNGFVAEVQSLAASFQANSDAQLSPAFPNVDALIELQGQRIVADVISLNQQTTVGLLTSAQFTTQAEAAINALTGGPLYSLETPPSAYVTTTQNFEAGLKTLNNTLSAGATPSLTIDQVSTTLTAEAEAYRNNLHAALQVTHPNISNQVDVSVNTLETTVSNIALANPTDAQAQVTTAINAFDTAMLDTTGLFGPEGAPAQVLREYGYIPHNLTVKQAATTLGSVSGTASFGGAATLTATLTSTAATGGLAGKTVVFTLDGAFAGTAVTDSSGVAKLTGVATSGPVGPDTGAVVASFAGDIGNKPSNGTGDLVVSPAATTLSAASGTATFGGPATLVATLTSDVTGQGVSGATVAFTLSGTSVGTALTDSSGVATLKDVTTTDTAGTHTGAVVASFAGDTNYAAAANATGDLVVSQAATTLGTVSGTASFGGTATLVATLTSNVTGQGISGETVTFTLDGTSVGSKTTDSNGVATLTGVTTSDPVGTHTRAVVASFTGDTNYIAAANATGDLVVSKAATSFNSVAGTATGGTATLTATLLSAVTNQPLAGVTVNFSLDSTSVGSKTTDSNGVATLTGVTTSDPVGTHPGAVAVAFPGNTDYNSNNATGSLVVS